MAKTRRTFTLEFKAESVRLVAGCKRVLTGKGRHPAHSDRGSQYAREHYQRPLARHGVTCSVSCRANCWANTPMENVFASLEKELTRGEL